MNNFDLKKYLAEGKLYENVLAQKLRDEAKQPDSKVGASIFNKYAKKIENADKADYKKIIKAMESELISKHPDTFSGEDDIPGSFLSEGKTCKICQKPLIIGKNITSSRYKNHDYICRACVLEQAYIRKKFF